jgi:outer membrane protein insertion porin family
MIRTIQLLVYIGIISAFSILYGQEGYELEELYFTGNESFSDDELVGQTSLFTISWFEKTILRKDEFIFSEEYLKADLKKLIQFYQQHGYINSQISYRYLDINHLERSLNLEIVISEDGFVSVNDLNFIIQSENPSIIHVADSLLKFLNPNLILKKNNKFADSALENDRVQITNQFLNQGFAYIEVEYELVLAENDSNVDISWIINPGPLCYFGSIQILGEKDVLFKPEICTIRYSWIQRNEAFILLVFFRWF